MFAKSIEKFSNKAEKFMNNLKSSNLIKYFLELGKMLVVYLVIFQMLHQPIAVLAQSKAVLQVPVAKPAAKSNIKPRIEDSFENFLPNFEKKARKTYSDAFGAELPLPQVFGENGKLQALLAGGNSSADKNKELIDSVLNKETESKSSKSKVEKTPTETAISLNAPILNGGNIQGSLRVLRETPFALNNDFYISENLYTVGSPNISTAQNSEIQSVINEESDDLSGNYPLFLNGGRVDGNIYIHSTTENILGDIPLNLPKPSGTEAVEINSAADLKNIKDWKSVKTLTINAANLTIPIPAGNYQSITLNAPNKLVFGDGNYNFTETVNLQKGSSIEVGKTTIGIGKNLFVEDASIKVAAGVLPESVKINVLGSSVVLSGKSEIEGAVRATNANVVVNENSKITGRVIAGSLVMNGGTIAENSQTSNRVFGLKQYNRTSGAPNVYTDNFARNACQAPYTLKIYNGNSDGSNRVSSATVKLNGATVVAQNAFNQNVAYIERTVNLNANNTLEARLTSNLGSFFNLEIVGTNCGGNDTIAPVLTVTSPQNNATTTDTAITVNGTATDNVGISQVLVNNTQATYTAATNTWSLANFPLNLGANQISVKAIDNAGNETIQTVTITRQPAVVDVTPPVLTISSPADNSTTQAQTITVTGTATDTETNASGLASVTVNGQNVNLSLNGNWTISDVALNVGSNTITARAADNSGNISTQTITVVREEPDTTAPTLAITAPGNNSETNDATITVSGTVTDSGANPSGVASVTVNGQSATINGNSWTIANVSLTLGANVIIANALDNAGNSSSQQITVTRDEPDTTAPTIVIISPTNNFETNETTININGTANDLGTNASGVQSVSVNGQAAAFNSGNWSFNNVSLNIGANTITVRAVDVAGNEATETVTVIRREPDNQAPTVTISSPTNNFTTTDASITVSGTVADNGSNASGIQSVVVNGVSATINGGNWTASNVSLNASSNTITAMARDNNNNVGTTSITVVRNPLDTQPPTITITTPTNNFETFNPQIVVSGTVTDTGGGATGVQSITVNGVPANYNPATNAWMATVNLVDGVNTISVVAMDNAPTPNVGQTSIQVTKIAILPPTLTITNPSNGAFLSANSVTVAGNVASNKPDMTFSVTVNGTAANLAGREFTKTLNLADGANTITVIVTDALGQQAQQAITVTNDRTPPTVFLTNVPQVVNPGESYTIGATASDAYGIADVEFTVNGASITRSSVSPYQFVLNIPLNQTPNQTLNISAIARDNAGLSATATAGVVTSGPSGLTGYVFDDATGYVLPNANARLNTQNPVPTDENGLYSFVSSNAIGNILITKQGYTSVERSYSATPGAGVEVFDARLMPLDTRANTTDANGAVNASDSGNKIQIGFAPASFPGGTDVRVTPVSPQGLANLLPFGWSPIPDAIFDIRAASETEFSNRNFATPASLSIPQIAGLPSDLPIVLARYNPTTHAWTVVQRDLFAGANGALQANLPASGQYAFLVADAGVTAPPNAVAGENLPASAAANSEQLDNATATAVSSPSIALYSANAKSRINFIANSASKLPSGVSIEASFTDSYLMMVGGAFITIDRPSQDFVLYSYPSVSTTEPNKLGAYFVAKPIRTDFGITDLQNAKVRVDIRSGRLAQTGILIGQTGGVIRGLEGSELEIPNGAVNNSQIVFFNKIPNNQTGVVLPQGYEMIGAFDVNLAGNVLTQTAKISMPSISGDNTKIVVGKVISIAGQPGLKVVGRVTENNSRLESTVSQPSVPAGVNLTGIRDSGKYVFVKMPQAFGYIRGTVSSSVQNTQAIKITNTQTPFVDLAGNNGNYTILGLANVENIQVDAVSLNNDATGFGTTQLAAQDAVSNLPISLLSAILSVQTVTPTNGATNVVVTTPVTVTFNKPVLSSTVTGSNIKLVTAAGNPVITTITTQAGGRSVILTPSSNLQSGTDYRVRVTTSVRDIYGNALANAFESNFRTANAVTVNNQLQPSQIRISYPNEQGFATISIPAGAVPSGSLIFAVNNSTGATVSTVAGSTAIELQIQARVGDEIELIIRQPDGSEHRVKQAAYRRADGFVSVGSNGGTITSEDGTLVLQVPAGAISGQADVKMTFAAESTIAIPREGEMASGEMNYIGGVKIEAQGNFTNTQELHLEMPAPANVQEGQRALVMKPSRINTTGTEFDSWETITSAKVEGGKIKSTSPPFTGINLASITGAISSLFYYVFMPSRVRVITGTVRKQESNGTFTPINGAVCSIKTPDNSEPRIYATSQPNGQFTISHNDNYYPANQNIPVLCAIALRAQEGIAFPFSSSEQSLSGFEVRRANIVFPSTLNQQPQILFDSEIYTVDTNNNIVLDTIKTSILRNQGKFILSTNSSPSLLKLTYKITPAVASTMSPTPQVIFNGVSSSLSDFQCSNEGQTKICSKYFPADQPGQPGRYSFVVKARTVLNDVATESTGVYNLVALANPNDKPSIPNANPFVETGWTPNDGATQIDVGTSIRLEFSEPVKNLVGGTTVYLTEGSSIQKIGGTIRSGAIEVNPNQFVAVVDFTPTQRLKSGKNYKITVSHSVVDEEARGIDQNEAESGWQDFTSRFTTFQGSVIYPPTGSGDLPGINDGSYKLAVLDDNVITAKAIFNGIGIGYLNIYDSSVFLGSNNPEDSQPVGTVFVPQIPTGLAAEKGRFIVDGVEKEISLVAVSTHTLDGARPKNVWFYNINAPERPRLIGVVSVVGNGSSGQIPGNLVIHNKRAYIGNLSNGGVSVIDIEQALNNFKAVVGERSDADDANNEFNNEAVRQAILPNQGFGQSALMQKTPFAGGNDYFPVYEVSTISQTFTNENNVTVTSPVTYAASGKQKLVGFNLNASSDGLLGFSDLNANGIDDRVLVDIDPTPLSFMFDVEAVSQLQIQGATKDLAVGVSSHLWIYDVTQPRNPLGYQAKSFEQLGLPAGILGKQVEVEDTLVYVMFDDRIAVFDISNPDNPYLTTVIEGLGGGLKRLIVRDGLIYTIGNQGLRVSIGRAVAQVVTYGDDGTGNICGNPVVIKRSNNQMAQPAGVFFQVYGHDVPTTKKIVIRKVEIVNGVRTEQEIGTTTDIQILSATPNGAIVGKGQWGGNGVEIDQSAIYTAQIVLDENTGTEFESKQFEIPFSYLIPEGSYSPTINIRPDPILGKQNSDFKYLLAGNSKDVNLRIETENIILRNRPPRYYELGEPKGDQRAFGQNADYFRLEPNRADGTYEYTFSATLNVTPPYTEEIAGTVQIGNVRDDLRQPGSTVVNGVEINKGNLALSENEAMIKGRGLSLEYTRSYNSQQANSFGTLGYGWLHSYQVSLTKREARNNDESLISTTYQLSGGEGSGQVFIAYGPPEGTLNAAEPYLGKLQINSDGTFDYFTKSRVKYHFENAFDVERNTKTYYGNLKYIEEPNGNRITLFYDSGGKLKSVVDSSNRSLNFEYEVAQNTFAGVSPGEFLQGTQGCPKINEYKRITRQIQQSLTSRAYRINRVTGPGGMVINYTYDENGNLETSTRNGADGISEPTTERQWKYTYYQPEGSNNRNAHLLKTVKSPNNANEDNTEYSYYFSGTTAPRVKDISMPESVSNHFSYDNQTGTDVINRATFTDGKNNLTRYDLEDNRVSTITAPLGAITRLEWTEFGQIKKTTDPEGKITEIIFDDNHNPATQTVTGGDETIETITTFDAKFSKMSSFTDGNGNLTRYSINQTNGNVDDITLPNSRTVLFHYFPNGDLKDVTDQYGTRTNFSNYDGYGNPQTITKVLGNNQSQIITQNFDVRSRLRGKSDNLGTNVAIEYDALDRPFKEINEDPAGYRNALTVETTFLPEGQPSVSVQKEGETQLNKTENTYDKLQRLKQTKETVSGYPQPFIRLFTYDNNSNLETEQNRRGITSVKSYNALNHLTRIVQGGKTVWEATEIDKVGNPKKVKDLFANETIYVYDGLQRLKDKQLPESRTEKLEYDDNNNITASFDRNGKKTQYFYDKLNRVESVIDALGRLTKWTYTDAEHKVEKETVHRGLKETTVMDGLERPLSQRIEFSGGNYLTSYVYTGRNVSITDARGTVTTQKLSGFGDAGETEVTGATPVYKTTAFYSALGGVRQMRDALNRVTTVINDGFNRPVSININNEFSETRSYDGEGLLTEHRDRRGVLSEMSYDELGRKFLTKVKGTIAQPTDIEAEKITYDDATATETVEAAANHAGSRNQSIYFYDGLRRVEKITNAAGDSKSLKYDGENLLEETDFYNDFNANRKTKYIYDAINRVTEVYDRNNGHTVIEYNSNDSMKTVTDRRGSRTVELTDALGRTKSVTDAEGKIASFTYDGNSNRLTQQDGRNLQTSFEYDKLNRLITITHPNGLQTENITYDSAGNVKTQADGRGGITEVLEYDSLDQAKRVKDGAGNITKFEYDGAGLLLSKTEPKGFANNDYKTTYSYNAFGSLTSVTEPQQPAWSFGYDNAQNLRTVQDALGRNTTYEYDAMNRMSKTIQPLGRTTEYTYDKNSNVASVKDPKGQTATMTYDRLDRLASASYQANGLLDREYQYDYDAEDNLWRVFDSRTNQSPRISTRSYDFRNRLTQATDATGKTVSFSFDEANNLTNLTSSAKNYTYDYDQKNQLDTVTQNGTQIADYDWFSDGLLQKVSYQNSTSRNYVYDDADRVTRITNNFGASQSESYDYGYDANSNRTSEIRKENNIAKRTASYDYDKLNRLTKADYTANAQEPPLPPLGSQVSYNELTDQNTYGYDAVGNRINETNKTQTRTVTISNTVNGVSRQEQTTTSPEAATTATFNDLNELTQLNEPNGISNFTYDLNGNLKEISKTVSGQTNIISKYDYDIRNQLTKAKDGSDVEIAKFDYDFERKRTAKTSNNLTTNYVYAGSQVISEFAGATNTANYAIGAGEIVKSEFANGENNFHFTDALGSVTSLIDTNGSLTSRNEYNAFGEVATNGSSNNSIGYTGQRLDNETGLMALGNSERYYSPNYARFIQQDSWLGNSSMPQSLNRFSYAHNNPNKYTDPSGNEATWGEYAWNRAGESLELWNEFALGIGDAFEKTGKGVANIIHGLETDPSGTLNGALESWNKMALEIGEVVQDPVLAIGMVMDFAMENPHAFMRSFGEEGGNLIIAETTATAASPITKPIVNTSKKAIINTATKTAVRVGETTAGKAATRIATETMESVGTRLSSTVERIGQKTTALKQSIGENFGKVVDRWTEHSNKAVERAIQNGRKGELGAVGDISKTLSLEEQYAKAVNSNKPCRWEDAVDNGANMSAKEKLAIKSKAVENGLVPKIEFKTGTQFPDFESAGLIKKADTLPENLWKESDYKQFDYLDKRIEGGRPEGTTWHHSDIPGQMELVPFGPHNMIYHKGGRSAGMWADAKR